MYKTSLNIISLRYMTNEFATRLFPSPIVTSNICKGFKIYDESLPKALNVVDYTINTPDPRPLIVHAFYYRTKAFSMRKGS